MKITRSLRIHKGTIAALFVFVPFLIAATKLTFFNKGCMDGFGHAVIGSGVIVLIGGPLTVYVSVLLRKELRSFFPTLTTIAKAFYLFGHTLALIAIPLAIWVALEISHGNFAVFDFRSKLPNKPWVATGDNVLS